jgi:hypothetical protein
MSCVLGLVIAIAVGLLVVCVVTWTTRFTGVTLWQSPRLARLRSYVAVPPSARAAGARTNGSRQEARRYTAPPRHHDGRFRGGPVVSLAPPEDSVWKVLTFVCHIPRLSAEERQHLLATRRDGHHAGAGPEHARRH